MNKFNSANLNSDNNSLQLINMQSYQDDALVVEAQLKFDNSFRYWANLYSALMRDNTVIFAAQANYKIVKLSPVAVVRQLISLELVDKLQGMNLLTNSAFFYIRFEQGAQAAAFQNASKQLDNLDINFLEFQGRQNEVWAVVESIPPIAIRELVPIQLEKIGEVADITPTMLKLPGGKAFESAPTKFKIVLHKDVTINQIPYYIHIGSLKGYMKIAGRKPICFNCQGSSHISKNCPYEYCKRCKKQVLEDHVCKDSYADKLKWNINNFNAIYNEALTNQFPPLEEEDQISISSETSEQQLGLQEALSSSMSSETFYGSLINEQGSLNIVASQNKGIAEILNKVDIGPVFHPDSQDQTDDDLVIPSSLDVTDKTNQDIKLQCDPSKYVSRIRLNPESKSASLTQEAKRIRKAEKKNTVKPAMGYKDKDANENDYENLEEENMTY